VYGWVFFGITMFVLFWMGAKWRDKGSTDASRASVVTLNDLKTDPRFEILSHRRVAPALLACMCAVAAAAFASDNLSDVQPVADFEARVLGAVGPLRNAGLTIQPRFAGARSSVQGASGSIQGLEVYAAYFANQADGHEMIAAGNAVIPEDARSWQLLSRAARQVSLGDHQGTVSEMRLRSPSGERLVWSWYALDGRVLASESKAKLVTAWAMLRGQGDHSSVAVVSVPVAQQMGQAVEQDDALLVARRTLEGIAPRLQRALP